MEIIGILQIRTTKIFINKDIETFDKLFTNNVKNEITIQKMYQRKSLLIRLQKIHTRLY